MKPFVPPRFVLKTAWAVHRRIARRGPGRGLWEPGDKKDGWGALTLITTGQRTNQLRSAIVAFHLDDANMHILAMNGWQEGHPAWWHNLRSTPTAAVTRSDGGTTPVTARWATGDQRQRLWQVWCDHEPELVELARARRTPTDVIVLTPDVSRETRPRTSSPGRP